MIVLIERQAGFELFFWNQAEPFLYQIDEERCLRFLHGEKDECQMPHHVTTTSKIRFCDQGKIVFAVENEETLVVYFYHEAGFGCYQLFQRPKRFEIGSHRQCEIQFLSRHVRQHHAYIDGNQLTVEDEFAMVYVNGVRRKQVQLQEGDELQIGILRIFVFNDFLMMNSVTQVLFKLEEFHPVWSILTAVKETPFHRKFSTYQQIPTLDLTLKEVSLRPHFQESPLIFSMGPGMMMALASLCTAMISGYNGYLQGRSWIEIAPMMILPLVMVTSLLLWNPLQRRFERKQFQRRVKQRNNDYEAYLHQKWNHAQEICEKWKQCAIELFDFEVCIQMIEQKKESLWAIHQDHSDFGKLVVGWWNKPVDEIWKLPRNLQSEDELNEVIATFTHRHHELKGCPLFLNLKDHRHWHLKQDAPWFLFNLLLQMLTRFGPESLQLVLCTDEAWLEENHDLLWLPHLCTFEQERCIATTFQQSLALVQRLRTGHKEIVVLCNQMSLLNCWNIACTKITFDLPYAPQTADLIFDINGYQATMQTPYSVNSFTLMKIHRFHFKTLALQLWNLTMQDEFARKDPYMVHLLDLYELSSVEPFPLLEHYATNKTYQSLVAYLGVNEQNERITLDLHEKGDGPHGLIAGTTGSGKSELLTTLVLSLSMHYPPEMLQFVFIDFKGAGCVQSFDRKNNRLPHLAGAISNLHKDKLERMLVSFNHECERRQSQFQHCALRLKRPIQNLDQYQQYCHQAGMEMMAHLVILVDEFAELKKQEPIFMDDLMSIARIGRSLGLHLILSTQKPSGIVNEQIWSNCHFKICMKVQDKADSQEVIECPDAAELTQSGQFYLFVDGRKTKGKAAYSHGHQNYAQQERVDELNLQHQRIATWYKRYEGEQTQCSLLLQKMNETTSFSASPLWMDEIEIFEIHQSDKKNEWILGMADDIIARQQWQVNLSLNQFSCLVLSYDVQKSRNFCQSLIQQMKHQQVHSVLRFYASYRFEEQSGFWVEQIALHQISRVRQGMKWLLRQAKEKQSPVYVFMEEFELFLQQIDGFKEEMEEVFALCQLGKIKLFVLVNTLQNIPYRFLARFDMKLVLSSKEEEEVRLLLNRSLSSYRTQQGYLAVESRVLFFTPVSSSTDIVRGYVAPSHSEKIMQLPAKLTYMMFQRKELLSLGIDAEEGKEIYVIKGLFMILAKSPQTLEAYRKSLNPDSYTLFGHQKAERKKLLLIPYQDKIEEVETLCRTHSGLIIICATVQQYYTSFLKQIQAEQRCLWIGQGYHEQSICFDSKIPCVQENEGVISSYGTVKKIRCLDYATDDDGLIGI